MNPWIILGIEKTDDKDLVKKAYMQMVAKHNPEDDPEGFQKVRAAYENALAEIDGKNEENVHPQIAEFVAKMKSIYDDFAKRIDPNNWVELFKDDVCLHLELEDELQFNLLKFLSAHSYLPRSVWRAIDKQFKIVEQREELEKNFNPQFIAFLAGNMSAKENGFNYDLFEIKEGKNFDRAIFLRNDLGYKLDDRNLEGIEDIIKELDDLEIYHPDFEMEKARYHALNKKPELALEMINSIFEKYQKDFENDSYARYVKGSVLMEFDDIEHLEESIAVNRALLEQYPDYYFVQINLMETLIKMDRLEEALEFTVAELLSRYPSNGYVLNHAYSLENKLIEKYEKMYNDGDHSEELVLKLADRYFHSYRPDDLFDLLMKHQEIKTAKYYLLLASSYHGKRDYEKTLEYAYISLDIKETFSTHILIIDCLKTLDRLQEALERSNLCLQSDLPTDGYNRVLKARIHKMRAEIYNEFGMLDKAIEDLNTALTINSQMSDVYNLKAEILISQGRFADAMLEAEASVRLFPMMAMPYELMVEIYFITGNFEQIDGIIEQAEKYKIVSIAFDYYKACALSAGNKQEEAITILKELATKENLGKWEEKIYKELHYSYHDLKKEKEALEWLNKGLEKLPNNEALLMTLTEFNIAVHGQKKGMETWELIMKHHVKNETAPNQLAMYYEDQDQPEKAIEILDKSIENFPATINLRIRRAFILSNNGKKQEALKDFLYALEHGSNRHLWWKKETVLYETGYLYHTTNDAHNAMKYFELAIQENDDYVLAHYYIGALSTDFFEDYKKSVEHLNKAIALDPKDHINYYRRGVAYKYMGKDDLAKKDFEKTIEMCESREITYHGDYTYVFEANLKLDKEDEALTALRKATKMVKTDGTYKGQCWCIPRAWAMYNLYKGDKAEATKFIQESMAMNASVFTHVLAKKIEAMEGEVPEITESPKNSGGIMGWIKKLKKN